MALPLTEMFEDGFSSKEANTHPGMAHLAGTGPAGRTCRTCSHFNTNGYYSLSGKIKGGLKPGKCGRYKALMRQWGKAVPHHASACRHYEENPNPPAPAKRVW